MTFRFYRTALVSLSSALILSACSSVANHSPTPSLNQPASPIVIAHRGASGYLPEHTLEAAVMAYYQGADFIEQDLVLSKDGELLVLHDIHLERTTDVEHKFPDRARQDGRFYAIDFTLAELQTLIVHERADAAGAQVFPGRYQGNAPFRLATFEQQIVLINQLNKLHNRNVGLYPEIKAPAWHRSQGQDISAAVVAMLRKHGLDNAQANIYVQCFDFAEVKRLKLELGIEAKLVQLIGDNSWQESTTDYDYLRSPQGLTEVAQVAVGIGPWFGQLIDPQTGQPTTLVSDAKSLGLKVHPYTFRTDQLPADMSAEQTMQLLFGVLKVDGVFSDHTDVSKALLENAE